MDLLILVTGIVLLWYGATALRSLMVGANQKAKLIAEKVAMDCSEQRTEQVEGYLSRMEGKQTYSHSEIMSFTRADD